MISLSAEVQRNEDFAYRLKRIRDLVRQGLVDPEVGTLSKQAQLLAEHCMKLTPPKTVTQGKKRTTLDINKIFHPVAVDDVDSKSLRRIIRLGDASGWEAFSRNVRSGPFSNTRVVEPTKDLHRANRDMRGRARKTNFVALYPQRTALRDIIRTSVENVGWAKAGWLRGYLGLGGKRAPEWVTRHAPGSGTLTDARFAENPMIAVYNTTRWGTRNDESRRIVGDAMRARTNAMKSYFEKTMQLASEGKTPFQMQQAAIAEQFGDAA